MRKQLWRQTDHVDDADSIHGLTGTLNHFAVSVASNSPLLYLPQYLSSSRLTIPLINTAGLEDVSLCLAFELQSLFGRGSDEILDGCGRSI